jgi:hypothetical protein
VSSSQKKQPDQLIVSPARSSRRFDRLFVLGGGALGLFLGWGLLPMLLYSPLSQPLDFNHLVHVEDEGMDCDSCHSFDDEGSFSGIPATALCAECHEEPMGDSAAELTLVQDYVEPGLEIPWQVYARQPQNVYFSHIHHVELAEISCSRCHGPHENTTTLMPAMINRISTYSRNIWGPRISGGGKEPWESMKMNDCSHCHAENGVKDHCLMCHK